jgi:transposase-like protein
MSFFSLKHLQDEQAAYDWVEAHLWPNGPVCPYCKGTERISKMQGKSTRIGFYKCYVCRKKFNVKVGTIFEASHIALNLWLQAFHLMAGSKKGISANQLARTLKVTLKTGWFIGHRIREAMRAGSLAPPMGSGGQFVEVDETYIGTRKGVPKRRGYPAHKMAVLTLVERGRDARSFHVENASYAEIFPIIADNIEGEAKIATDEGKQYANLKRDYASHETVNHKAEEWRRGDVHTNTVEGYFSVFKRGMKGVYQHCSEKHLHRYLAEFDFRYSNRVALGVNDEQRAAAMIRGVKGKRLTYRPTDGA